MFTCSPLIICMWVCMGVLLNVIWPYWRGLVFHFEAMAATLRHKQVFPGEKKKKKVWILFMGKLLAQPFGI